MHFLGIEGTSLKKRQGTETAQVSRPLQGKRLQNLDAEISDCYERARRARERAELAINNEFKGDFLAAEGRWLALALSYESRASAFVDFDRRRKVGSITLMLREQGLALDPEAVAQLDIAYHAVLGQLGLADRENGATLTIAKRIVDLAAGGERDPERLTAATVKAFAKREPS